MGAFKQQKALLLVFILGLSACSPDKTKRHEDQWRFTPPEIIMPSAGDNEGRTRLKMGEASQHELPLGTELYFPSINQIILEVESLCSVGGVNFQEAFRISNSSNVEVGSLVPSQALVQQIDQFTCSFEFTAINEHRSRHHFLMPGLKFIGANSYGSLAVSEKLQKISPTMNSEITEISVDELDQLAVESPTKSGIAELMCSDFLSRIESAGIDSTDWKMLAYKQPTEILEKVLQKYRQTCRVAVTDEMGLRKEISAPFVLRYPPPQLSVETKAVAVAQSETSKLILLEADLKNTSPVDQVLAVPADNIMSASVQRVWGPSATAAPTWLTPIINSVSIRVELDGTDNTQVIEKKKTFSVRAGSTVHLKIIATGNLLRGMACGFNTVGFGGPRGGGYRLNFTNPFRVERFEVGTNNVTDEISLFNTLPHHIDESKVFIPFTSVKGNWRDIALQLHEHELPRCRGD